MKTIIALFVSLFCSVAAYSQFNSPNGAAQSTRPRVVVSDTTRFEIISLNGQFPTIRLDRYTGRTFQYAVERKWYLLEVRGGLPNSSGNSLPKYDIYNEDNSVFLINNETGQSWILNVRSWIPITD